MNKLLLCVAGLAVGCGPAGKKTGGTVTNAGGTGLGAVLAKEVGAGVPVAIVPGADGLRAISADGARQRTLVPGNVPWAIVDARTDVVWFGSADGADIRLLDLEGTGDVETVVTGLPTQTDGGGPLVTISYDVPGLGADTLTVGHPITPHVELHLSDSADTASLDVEGGILEMWEQEEEFRSLVKAATIVDPARLVELTARGHGRSLELGSGESVAKVDVDPAGCEDPEECGNAETVPPTKLLRVETEYSCGDGCYRTFRLYDPGTKTFVDEAWATWLQDAWVAPDGSAFVFWGTVVRFDSGPLAATPLGEDGPITPGGGWLGGGYYFGQ